MCPSIRREDEPSVGLSKKRTACGPLVGHTYEFLDESLIAVPFGVTSTLTGPRVLTTLMDENAIVSYLLLHHSSGWSTGDGVYRGIIYCSPLVFMLFGGRGKCLLTRVDEMWQLLNGG